MKKLMFAVSAALCATVGFSDVTSQNIVGYAKKGLFANKFAHVGAQFQDIKDGKLFLDNTISGLPGVDYDTDSKFLDTAPQIQIVQASGIPLKYYYLNDGWYDDGTEAGAVRPGWCDEWGVLVDLTITPGAGFWLWNTNAEDQEMNGAGQVEGKGSADVIVPGGIFSINAGVFPVVADFNNADSVTFPDIVGVDYDTDSKFLDTAPQIQIVQASGIPLKYYYLNDGWYDDGTEAGAVKSGWCDEWGVLADVKLQPQSGCWVWAKTGSFTITYKK